MRFVGFILALLCSACVITQAAPTTSEKLHSDYFGSLPDVSHVSLSPSGTKIVAKILIDTPDLKGTAYQVTNLATNEKKIVLFTDNEKFDLNWVRWKTDEVLLAGVIYPETRVAYGPQIETRESDLIVINLKTGKTHNIFKGMFFAKFREKPVGRANVIDFLPEDKNHVLMGVRSRLSDAELTGLRVYKVNVYDQRAKLVQKPIRDVYEWWTDQQHRIRLSEKFDGSDISISVLDLKTKKWKELWKYKNYSEENVTPLGFGLDPNVLYVRAYHNSLQAIYSVNVQDPSLKLNLIYANANYDVDGVLLYSQVTKDVIGISSSYNDGVVYFDEELKALQASIDKGLPRTQNFVYSLSKDHRKYLVYSSSDIESGTYLFGDRDKNSLSVIAYQYQNLTPEKMRPKQRWAFKARDGVEIEGFLTLPSGDKKTGIPTIVFPHGGPLAYDDEGFDYWVQFFANRGYAVFQPNFRGSEGRGLSFRNAGIENHAASMNDIEDATRALVKAGIADAARVCIVGASFGGYAALYGVTKTPDLYTCAISFAGLSDVSDRLMLNDEKRLVRAGFGGRKYSPIHYAGDVKAPVLLVHGDFDRQVDVSQSQRMYSALKSKGKDVRYVELLNEDHYLSDNENRRQTFREMDEFLSKYLPTD